jgi:hypothetical protein
MHKRLMPVPANLLPNPLAPDRRSDFAPDH